jgi:lysine 2,3-aminomutase
LRGVNDSPEVQRLLVRRLSWINVHPYYVYQHDMVRGVEDLRTTIATTIELEKQVRGATAGFNTPTFVVDLPGGGGKRDVHSYEHYDPVTGVAVYRSPNVDPDRLYTYFDPIASLPKSGRDRWTDPAQHQSIVDAALAVARARTS